ncbi:MAG: hypothetical protein WCJ09_03540 [Planctomycetota bacterium]
MDFGKITRPDEKIRLDEWNTVINSNDFLRPVPDREGVNPFTQERIVFPGEGKVYYVENGEDTGSVSLEDGVLFTTGVPKTACDIIAKQLNAQVFKDDRS